MDYTVKKICKAGGKYLAIMAVMTMPFLLRAWVAKALGDRPLLILFVIPTLISAYLGGWRGGLLATAIAALGTSLVIPVPATFLRSPARPDDKVQWLVLVLSGIVISIMVESARRARLREQRANIKLAEEQIRVQAADDIRALNAQLAAANQELQAFNYSVSHDLRAPLRGIDGYCQLLVERYSDKLDERGRTYLAKARAASQRMGQLIDDLLSLSRINRGDLRRENLDLSAIAMGVIDELRQREPERSVDFVAPEHLPINADRRLLTIAMTNLLGNAWKFTSKHPRARIELGVTTAGAAAEYFVRDDGAGFSMDYVDKLFGAFQRLHDTAEFPGSGIGLATVQRIINRHGGAIRAEGAVEKGATFYFRLSPQA